MTSWSRSIRLTVGEPGPFGQLGGVVIDTDSLRCRFSIERDEKPWPNSAEIRIWNLNEAHRDQLAAHHGVPCLLEAGYQDSRALIFEGMLREAKSEHSGTDWITTVSGGDGELDKDGEPIASKRLQRTWKRGTPCVQIVKDFAKAMNVEPGNAAIGGAAAKLTTGVAIAHAFSVDGPILDELIYFMRSVGLTWSIQDGAFQVRIAEVPASVGPLISSLTGLIGRVTSEPRKILRENSITREEETTEWEMHAGTCLLLPGLRPGYGFALESKAVTGTQLCTAVNHIGDTHGPEWHTNWESRNV